MTYALKSHWKAVNCLELIRMSIGSVLRSGNGREHLRPVIVLVNAGKQRIRHSEEMQCTLAEHMRDRGQPSPAPALHRPVCPLFPSGKLHDSYSVLGVQNRRPSAQRKELSTRLCEIGGSQGQSRLTCCLTVKQALDIGNTWLQRCTDGGTSLRGTCVYPIPRKQSGANRERTPSVPWRIRPGSCASNQKTLHECFFDPSASPDIDV